MNKQQTGKLAENLSCQFLKTKGYNIIERNFRSRYGEIDVVARKNNILIFIEIRSKSGSAFGSPEESFTAGKKQRFISTIMSYLNSHDNLPPDWRVDFVAVDIDQDSGKANRIEIYENALN